MASSLQPQPRNLILCLDGTNDLFDDSITNIAKLYGLLDKSDSQLSYYQPGLGTYVSPGFWKDTAAEIAGWVDSAFATFLDAHVVGAYRFLMNHHRQHDKIFLFGFSRGAYTARCLAGMLHKVGLLSQGNDEQLRFAYNAYIDTTEAGVARAQRFKDTFSKIVDIEFMGCWDTVQSIGDLHARDLPFTNSNQIIKTFRQALALDERRGRYMPTLWHMKSPNPAEDPNNPCREAYKANPNAQGMEPVECEEYRDQETNVQEVWFVGGHSDVGGGSEETIAIKPSLSRLSLRWMMNNATLRGLLLKLDDNGLGVLGLKPDVQQRQTDVQWPISLFSGLKKTPNVRPSTEGPARTDRTLSLTKTAIMAFRKAYQLGDKTDEEVAQLLANAEANNETLDTQGEIHDRLKMLNWQFLEAFPFKYRYQDGDGMFHEGLGINAGSPREIFVRNPNRADYIPPNLHTSVAERDGYKIPAKFMYQDGNRKVEVHKLKVLLIQDDPNAPPIPAEVDGGRVRRL